MQKLTENGRKKERKKATEIPAENMNPESGIQQLCTPAHTHANQDRYRPT